MLGFLRWRLAVLACVAPLALACSSSTEPSGGGGQGGSGGVGGTPVCDLDTQFDCCLDLLSCCEAILVNPVFFQSCNAVVLRGDDAECRDVLAGYVRCRTLDL
jgi:hypothetical protein